MGSGANLLWLYVKKVLPAVLGIVLLGGLIARIGISNVTATLLVVDIRLIALGAAILSLAMLVKALRWHVLLGPIGIKDLWLAMYNYFLGQIANQLLPTGSGEILRISLIKGARRISAATLIPGIIIERFCDTALLLVLTLALSAVIVSPAIAAVLVAITSLCVVLIARPSALVRASRMITGVFVRCGLGAQPVNVLSAKIAEISGTLAFYGRAKGVMFTSVLLTIFAWVVLETSSQYVLLLGAGFRIPFVGLLGIVAASWILGTVSMLPGGLGAMEFVYALGLTGVGVPFETGLSLALLYRAMIYLLFTAFTGLFYCLCRLESGKSTALPGVTNDL